MVNSPDKIALGPPHWLAPERGSDEPLWDQFDPVALLEANVLKMQHQQATSQWIRTWAFAFTGFFLGYAYLIQDSVILLLLAFVLVETILFIILLKDVEWHRMFWRYRDRARLCEAYLLGNVDRETCRREYLQAIEASRADLLRDAFSLRKLATVSTDFVESYLIVGLGLAFAMRLVLAVYRVFPI